MKRVVLFARLLRDAGLTIAPSEVSDAVNGLTVMESNVGSAAHSVILKAALVKRVEDQPIFETMYQLFFGDVSLAPNKSSIGQIKSGSDQGIKSAGFGTLAISMLQGDFAPCQACLRGEVQKIAERDVPLEELVRRVLVNLDYFSALNSLRLGRERDILPEWQYQSAMQNADYFVKEVQNQVLRQLVQLGLPWPEVGRQLDWRRKSFNVLTNAEMGLVRSYLDKIGTKLAVRPGSKRKIGPSGDLDIGVTLKRAMARGGLVRDLVYSHKLPEKPELVLLCDVSNSVYRFTGFMLQLVVAFRQKFKQVRAFVFVDTLWEVPSGMFATDLQTNLEDIKENNRCSISGLSDFGQVFCQFAAEFLPQLSPLTTLLVLGDGRNNWRPPEVEAFKRIVAGLKKVYWLNPLPQSEWGQEDCQIKRYAPYCKGVFECGNLSQLEQIAQKVL